MKRTFDVYEKDGAMYRGPVGERIAEDIWLKDEERWTPFNGARTDPVLFGSYVGQQEMTVPDKS
jgi:hypothetical protein